MAESSPAEKEKAKVLPIVYAEPRTEPLSREEAKLRRFAQLCHAKYGNVEMCLIKELMVSSVSYLVHVVVLAELTWYRASWMLQSDALVQEIIRSDAEYYAAYMASNLERSAPVEDWLRRTPLPIVQTDLHRLVNLESSSSLRTRSSLPTLSSDSSFSSSDSSDSEDDFEAVTPPSTNAALPDVKMDESEIGLAL
jgi:hypothetical protein